MLGHLELDTEVSDAGIETAESDDCKGMSKKDGDANGVLAVTREGVRFSCKDGQKFINPFTQSISGLCRASQLYPRIKEQEESSRVTSDSYNHWWEILWASWQFQRWCCLMNHQTSREQPEELRMSSGGKYSQI